MKPPPPTEKLPAGPRIHAPARNPRPSAYKPPPVVLHVRQAKRSGGSPVLAGWVVLLVGFGLACIPLLGVLAWVIGGALCLAAFALAIVGMATGRMVGGLLLLCASLVAPVIYAVTPLVSIVATAFALDDEPPPPKVTPADKVMPAEGEKLPEGWVPRDFKPPEKK